MGWGGVRWNRVEWGVGGVGLLLGEVGVRVGGERWGGVGWGGVGLGGARWDP